MDFFDSTFSSVSNRSNSVNDDSSFFESEFSAKDDNEYVTEVAAETALFGSIGLMGFAFVGLFTVAIGADIKDEIEFKSALKNYQSSNPSIIPLSKLDHKRFKISGFEHDKKELRGLKKYTNAPGQYIDAYYTKSGEEVVAFNCSESVGYNTYTTEVSVYDGSHVSKSDLEYYIASYFNKKGVWTNSSEVQGWVEKWSKKDKESNKNESFEYDPVFDLVEEFFPESAVDTILAPLSKFRSNIASWRKNKLIGAGKEIAKDQNRKVPCKIPLKRIEKIFLEYISDVESEVLPKVKSHAERKEIVEPCSEATKKFFNSYVEALKDREYTSYTRGNLAKECARITDVVSSSADKILRVVEAAKKDDDPNFARACSAVITKTSGVCSKVMSSINSLSDQYNVTSARNTGRGEGYAVGYGVGYGSGRSSGYNAGYGAGSASSR